jgi:hypothetical protein
MHVEILSRHKNGMAECANSANISHIDIASQLNRNTHTGTGGTSDSDEIVACCLQGIYSYRHLYSTSLVFVGDTTCNTHARLLRNAKKDSKNQSRSYRKESKRVQF